MDCRAAVRLVPAFVDGELTPDKEALLKEHMASCHSCHDEMVALRRAMNVVDASPGLEPAFGLADIRARAAERQARREWTPAFAWLSSSSRWATAALALVALVTGSVSGIYHGIQESKYQPAPSATVARTASDPLGLDAFDNGLANALYVSASTGAVNQLSGEVAQ